MTSNKKSINSGSNKWKSIKMNDADNEEINKRIIWSNQNARDNKKIPNTKYLSINLHEFSVNNISFMDTKVNKIIDGIFSGIIYSDSDTTFNGIYLTIPYQLLQPYMRNNNTLYKSKSINSENIVKQLVIIESDIINYYQSFFKSSKIITKIVQNQFDSASIKISNDQYRNDVTINESVDNYIFKISGIWETDTNIGITLKYLQ